MKILQVTPTFVPSKFGGVKVVSYNLSKTLANRRLEVTVYTTDADIGCARLRDIHGITNVDGMNVRYFRNISNLLAFKYRLFLPIGMALALRKEMGSFNLIHFHDFRSFQNIIIHHYAKKYNIPYVLQAHGSLPRIIPTQGLVKQQVKKLYDVLWGYRLLKDASRVIAVTKAEAEQYKSMGVSEDKIEVVPNGIDLSEFDNLPERGEFRRKYGLNDNQRIILYLGRIHKTKGLDLLLKAFDGLLKNFNDVKLVIAGPDDGYLPALKKLIKELKIEEKVLFTGPLYGREKASAYVDADVFVNPRADEIFGLVFLEACACGTPVICSSGCGIADIIDGQAGIVVPYDKEQIRHALLYMLGDDKMRQEFGERGKSLVREKFNWQKIAEQMERVYRDIL